jgi:sporulation protein YlmC with PRC-barrel domain
MRPTSLLALTIIISMANTPLAVRAADLETLPDTSASGEQGALQCQSELRTFIGELVSAGFGVLPPAGYSAGYASYGAGYYGSIGTPRQQIQALRDAAEVYAFQGNEEACQTVLASMRQIYEEHDALVSIEADDLAVRIAWRRAHLANAMPVTDMDRLMRVDLVTGADLRTPKDETLGEIKDVVLDAKRQTIAYVLVSRGGFLGLGKELVAIRWTDLRATANHEIFVLDATPEAFAAAPKVERWNFEESAGEAWRDDLDEYWASAVDKK